MARNPFKQDTAGQVVTQEQVTRYIEQTIAEQEAAKRVGSLFVALLSQPTQREAAGEKPLPVIAPQEALDIMLEAQHDPDTCDCAACWEAYCKREQLAKQEEDERKIESLEEQWWNTCEQQETPASVRVVCSGCGQHWCPEPDKPDSLCSWVPKSEYRG